MIEVLEHAGGQCVGNRAEDRGGPGSEHPLGDLAAVGKIHPVVGDRHVGGRFQAEARHRALKRLAHLSARPDVEAQMGDADAPVAQLGKVLERLANPDAEVGQNHVRLDPRDLTVDQHDRPADRRQQRRPSRRRGR